MTEKSEFGNCRSCSGNGNCPSCNAIGETLDGCRCLPCKGTGKCPNCNGTGDATSDINDDLKHLMPQYEHGVRYLARPSSAAEEFARFDDMHGEVPTVSTNTQPDVRLNKAQREALTTAVAALDKRRRDTQRVASFASTEKDRERATQRCARYDRDIATLKAMLNDGVAGPTLTPVPDDASLEAIRDMHRAMVAIRTGNTFILTQTDLDRVDTFIKAQAR